MKSMENKVVLITGGTSGYGLAMAKLFTQEGAKVVAAARGEKALAEAASETGCDTLKMDVTEYADWERARDDVLSRYGRIDILINNAGGGVAIKPLIEQTKDEIDRALALNLAGVCYAGRVFAPVFIGQKSGTIINIASVCARHCWPEWSVYAAAKAGVMSFSKSLYTELQPYGVRVTCLIPAAASTGFRKAAGIPDADNLLGADDIAQTALFICALPPRAVVEDVTVWGIDQIVQPL